MVFHKIVGHLQFNLSNGSTKRRKCPGFVFHHNESHLHIQNVIYIFTIFNNFIINIIIVIIIIIIFVIIIIIMI